MISRRDVLKGAAAGGLWIAGGRQAEAWRQLGSAPGAQASQAGERLIQYIDPFIGTGGHGHTFPGPACPSGMVQLSPDSGKQGWDWCAGYHYTDTAIAGFSHTHLSGTGIGDLCDILVTPTHGRRGDAGRRDVAVLARAREGVGGLLLRGSAGLRNPGRADRHAARRRATDTRSCGRRPGSSPRSSSTWALPSTRIGPSTRRSPSRARRRSRGIGSRKGGPPTSACSSWRASTSRSWARCSGRGTTSRPSAAR